jgi:hypothetical protein
MEDASVVRGNIPSVKKKAFLKSFETVHWCRDLDSASQQVRQRGEQEQEEKSQHESTAKHSGFPSVDRHDVLKKKLKIAA